MKLFKALVGLAAAASVIPLKVEKSEENGKKTVRISSLTWKAEYTSATEEDDATLNVDLMGGLKEIVKKKEKAESEETEEIIDFEETDDNATEEEIEHPSFNELLNELTIETSQETPEYDLADRVSGGGVRWAELDVIDLNEEEEEEEEPIEIDKVCDTLKEVLKDADTLFPYAVESVVNFGKASTSWMQRKFTIGYGRAAKIIDGMTKCRIVSTPDGSKARNLQITVEQWEQIKKMLNLTVVAPEDPSAKK